MRGTRLQIRPAALAHNAGQARTLADGAQVFAMIKANGYGHGLTLAADAVAGQVDGLGVALMEEARAVREHGAREPILVAEGFFDQEEIAEAARLDVEVVVHAAWQVALLSKRPAPLGVWLKINTGMNRLGMVPEQAREQAAILRAIPGVRLLGLMSHFACADQQDDPLSERQLAEVLALSEELLLPVTAANSAALIRYPAARRRRVRPGIMRYGSSPFPWRSASELGLRPTQRFSARLIAVNPIGAGQTVGYGATWRAPESGTIGVVAVGYGDGYPRHAPNGTPVAVNGRRTELVGRVSMDMITVRLDGLEARVGDEVELWGDTVSVDEVAAACGTISYELFCQITARPERVVG